MVTPLNATFSEQELSEHILGIAGLDVTRPFVDPHDPKGWRQLPQFARLAIAGRIVSGLAAAERADQGEISEAAKGLLHGLYVVLGIKWNPDHIIPLQHADVLVEAFRQGVIVTAQVAPQDEIEKLRKKYRGTIRIGIVGAEAQDMARRFSLLLTEWQPIGKMVSQLSEILGEELTPSGGMTTVMFDHGFGGWRFVFKASSEGIITNVDIRGSY